MTRFRRAGDCNVGHAIADVVAGDADGVRCRRARRAGCERRSLDAEFDADVSRGRRTDDAQKRQRMCRALVVNEEVAVGGLECGEATGARTDNACRPIRISERHFEPCHFDRFFGSCRSEPGIAIRKRDDAIAFEMFQALLGIEILDLCSDQNLEIVQRKSGERSDAGLPRLQTGPEIRDILPNRGYNSEARDDDTAPRFTIRHQSIFLV